MKTQIRHGVFESNSSSTHSLTLCNKDEFEAWKNGELLFNRYHSWSTDAKFVKPYTLTELDKTAAQKEYDANKEIFWADWENLSDEAKNKWYKKYAEENDLWDEDYCTYENYMHYTELETFVESYTSPSGDQIVAFGRYGYDG